MPFYLDTSALVRLVVDEPETQALFGWLSSEPWQPVACDLARIELLRAVRRAAPDRMTQARAALETVTLTQVTTAVVEAAARPEPWTLRTLDALHLASALDLGDDLEGLVTYDGRLADAARYHGVGVVSPGGLPTLS